MRVVPQLIKTGKYIRPALGIEVDEQLNQRLLALTGSKGVFVLRVTPALLQRTKPGSRVSKSRRKASCRATASSMLMARRRTMWPSCSRG